MDKSKKMYSSVWYYETQRRHCNRFARDDKGLGPQLEEIITPNKGHSRGQNTEFSQETSSWKMFLGSCCSDLFFAAALSRGIYSHQDRPYCRADVKLTHGADEQAVFLRSYLVQNRLGDFYTHSSLQGGSEFSAISG
jgi:hypothetical protein